MKQAQLSHFRVVADGGCRRNGKPDAQAYGSFAVIAVGKDGSEETGVRRTTQYETVVVDGQGSEVRTPMFTTSNACEYQALIDATCYLIDLLKRMGRPYPVIVHMDSRLVMDQLSGRAKVKAAHLKPMHDWAALNLAELQADWHWRPREEIAAVLGH